MGIGIALVLVAVLPSDSAPDAAVPVGGLSPLCKVGLALLATAVTQVPGMIGGALDLIGEHCF
ncbi:MAG: hypothetical protein ACT4PE_08595 [Candidatus Eiseniibacteriota bacterium]